MQIRRFGTSDTQAPPIPPARPPARPPNIVIRGQIIPTHKHIDRSDFIWLCYLIFFLIEPITRNSATYWMKSLVVLGIFLLLYVLFLKAAALSARLVLLACMAILGAVCFPWNGGGPTFNIYAAAFAPFVLASLPQIVTLFVLDSALVALIGWRFHLSPYGWLCDILLIFMIGGMNVFHAQKHRADYKLRMQQEEIEALAAVAERERIARDLHDVLGHTLSLIVLKSELAGRLLDRQLTTPTTTEASSRPQRSEVERPAVPGATSDLSSRPERSEAERPAVLGTTTDLSSRPEGAARSGETPVFAPAHANAGHLADLARARAELAEVERTARTALAEVREAIGGYRARGLAAEIETTRQTLATAGVTLTTEGDLPPATLTAAEETVLALALREAVTNIVRHAEATTCRLRLVVEDGRHRLSIQDNGHHPAPREGNGLRGMRERVESLGGHLSLTREDGTHLQIELPLRPRPAT